MIFLKPLFFTKIWGGSKLKDQMFPYIEKKDVGEAWITSCMPGFESVISSAPFKNKTLQSVWIEHPELFNMPKGHNKPFPLLVKLLDASKDLSIQLHPDNHYAQTQMNLPFGKSECWYIINCESEQKLILGHNAKTKDEAKKMVEQKMWNKFIRKIRINPKEVFDIFPGVVHGICAGTLIYELQQASDTTFRLYDYDRLENGKPRELHIQESLSIMHAPQKYKKNSILKKIKFIEKKSLLKLIISNDFFNLYELDLYSDESIQLPELNLNYLIITCISGDFTLNKVHLHKGSTVILTADELNNALIFHGTALVLIAYAKN